LTTIIDYSKFNTRKANEVKQKQEQDLISAAQFAASLLSKVPAFGDSIGDKVSKAQIGIALNRLMVALTAISIEKGTK
jgi:hypothetical protein